MRSDYRENPRKVSEVWRLEVRMRQNNTWGGSGYEERGDGLPW